MKRTSGSFIKRAAYVFAIHSKLTGGGDLRKLSHRDRVGAFGDLKVAKLEALRKRRWRLITLFCGCATAFLAPFAWSAGSSWLGGGERPSSTRQNTGGLTRKHIPICSPGERPKLGSTCLVDGDTGWESGVKWRLVDVDTPELSNPGCPGEFKIGLAARDRLQRLMGAGYAIDWQGRKDIYGRELIRITLQDGSDAGRTLLSAGLAQVWPNIGNVWCGR